MPTQTIISTQRVMQPRLGQKKPIKLCFIIRTDDDTEIRPGHSRTNGPTRFRMKPPGGGPDIKTATPYLIYRWPCGLRRGAMAATEAGVVARPAREPRNPPAKTAGQSIN